MFWRTFFWLFLKTTLLSLAFVFIFLLLTALGVGIYGLTQLRSFSQTAQVSLTDLKDQVVAGWSAPLLHTNSRTTFLILGLDSLQTRGDVPPLTDTMMLASINFKIGVITTLPLPRDLWSEDYKTKINALYAYGLEQPSPPNSPATPTQLPQTVLQNLTGVPIHHVVTISLDQVAELIDILGGLPITVEHSFVDKEFPRPEVDITVERDPAKLYQTVEFSAGAQIMSGERALQFMRSRHSESQEGDDTARARRQQLVVQALVKQLSNPKIFLNATRAAQVFKYYHSYFEKTVSIPQGVAILKALIPHRDSIRFNSAQLSVAPADPQGVITHPPVTKLQPQWVYTIVNQERFQMELAQKLLQLDAQK